MTGLTTSSGARQIGADGNTRFLTIRYQWSETDPCALTLRFLAENCPPVNWTIARDLMAEALRDFQPHGEGDVTLTRVWPDTLVVHVESPDGAATIATTSGAAEEIVRQSLLLVPAGTELDGADLDGELAELLASGEAS